MSLKDTAVRAISSCPRTAARAEKSPFATLCAFSASSPKSRDTRHVTDTPNEVAIIAAKVSKMTASVRSCVSKNISRATIHTLKMPITAAHKLAKASESISEGEYRAKK